MKKKICFIAQFPLPMHGLSKAVETIYNSNLGDEFQFEKIDIQERDQYGRLLAYVWVDGVMFNKTLLASGMATVTTYPPNVLYVDDFTAIQTVAQALKVGIWEASSPIVTAPSPLFTPAPALSGIPATPYIGNSNTMKFHYSSCSSVSDMSISNMVPLQTRNQAINDGYIPCKRCNP